MSERAASFATLVKQTMCILPECKSDKLKGFGLCNTHYREANVYWNANGYVKRSYRAMPEKNTGFEISLCIADDCDEPSLYLDNCRRHYNEYKGKSASDPSGSEQYWQWVKKELGL